MRNISRAGASDGSSGHFTGYHNNEAQSKINNWRVVAQFESVAPRDSKPIMISTGKRAHMSRKHETETR